MTRFGAGALLVGALSLSGCVELTAAGAAIAGLKSIYDFTGTVAGDVNEIVFAASCKSYRAERAATPSGDPSAAYGDAYCDNPPAGSDPVESAIWLGQLIEQMRAARP